jgi:TrmH family RNA methyltransferase
VAREDEQAFVIEGPTLVAEAVRANWPLEAIYVEEGASVEGLPAGTPVARGVLERVATTVAPRLVLAVARRQVAPLGALSDASFVVVLAALADPGNLGTIVRSAEAAGVDGVVVAGGVDPFNPKSVRASAGSIFFVPLALVDDGTAALEDLGSWGMRRIGTRADADRPYDEIDMRGAVALVLGSESHGIDDDVAARVDEMVSIPMAGQAESLNVAAAAAVLCFEVARQRRGL